MFEKSPQLESRRVTSLLCRGDEMASTHAQGHEVRAHVHIDCAQMLWGISASWECGGRAPRATNIIMHQPKDFPSTGHWSAEPSGPKALEYIIDQGDSGYQQPPCKEGAEGAEGAEDGEVSGMSKHRLQLGRVSGLRRKCPWSQTTLSLLLS